MRDTVRIHRINVKKKSKNQIATFARARVVREKMTDQSIFNPPLIPKMNISRLFPVTFSVCMTRIVCRDYGNNRHKTNETEDIMDKPDKRTLHLPGGDLPLGYYLLSTPLGLPASLVRNALQVLDLFQPLSRAVPHAGVLFLSPAF